ncbi:GIY-YIG nuclease family protein [Brevibacillus panacihumi]|uniref:GIY-YIG nuclease family protein n=1 Tax=Brevibacillus panacihumi TaxID=497735 RepID=UPI003D22272B
MADSFGYVYLLGCELPDNRYVYKIGRTKNLIKRFEQFGKLPIKIDLLSYYITLDMFSEERLWHKKFGGKRLRGEWFELNSYDLTKFIRHALDVYKDFMSSKEWFS